MSGSAPVLSPWFDVRVSYDPSLWGPFPSRRTPKGRGGEACTLLRPCVRSGASELSEREASETEAITSSNVDAVGEPQRASMPRTMGAAHETMEGRKVLMGGPG
jgi:hypothetical protein